MITTMHHNLSEIVSKQILKSVIGSLNATAIAYARGHLRFNAVESGATAKESYGYKRPVHADEKHIDDYNDARAAIDESIQNSEHAELNGFEKPMPNDELCERLMCCRDFLADKLRNMATLQNDLPLSIAETVKFQMERTQDNNDDLVEALAMAVDIDPEVLKAAKIKMIEDDQADLKKNAGKIVTFLEAFNGTHHEAAQVEELFAGMPAHVQYKLVGAGIRAHDKANQRALQSLLRGKLDAAGDIKMLKASKADLILWIKTFSITNKAALNAYLERGGMLPEFDDGTTVVDAAYEARKAPQKPGAKWASEESEAAHTVVTAQQIDEGDGIKPTPAHVEALVEKFKPASAPGTKAKRVSKKKQAEIQTTA